MAVEKDDFCIGKIYFLYGNFTTFIRWSGVERKKNVIFCENKDAYVVEDILYKEAINKNYIFHNQLLTKSNVNSVKFSNIAPVIYKYKKDNETLDKSISEISVDILNNTSFDSIANEFPSEFSTPDDDKNNKL